MERKNPFSSIYKQCNASSNMEKNDWQKENVSVPRLLDIELTNCCNMHCRMCPVGTGVMKRTKGFMSDRVFERILEDVKEFHIPAVRLIRWGEPTLHPKFFEYGEKLKSGRVMVHFNTNGLLLNEESIRKIVELKIDSMKFSFQGIDKLTYEEMRDGGDDLELLNIIKMTYQIRGDKEFPYISVTTSTTYESDEDIVRFKSMIRAYCDEVSVGKTKMQHVDVQAMGMSEERRKIYENYVDQDNVMARHIEVCPEVWDKLSINWDGSVSACCQDYDNLMVVGNILESSLKDIFNGLKELQYREILKYSDYNKLPLCKYCFEYIPLKK